MDEVHALLFVNFPKSMYPLVTTLFMQAMGHFFPLCTGPANSYPDSLEET